LAGVVRWTLQTHASQGRLLFGAIAPLSIFLAAGILSLARPMLRMRAGQDRARSIALSLSVVLALVAGIIPPAYIAPRYAPPPVVPAAALPASLRPVQAIFGGQIELLGYTVQDEPVAPGEAFSVTLYWRGRQRMAIDYNLALHLLGRGQAAQVGKLDTWPGGGNAATSRWTPGAIYADTYRLPVAAGAEVPTQLWLDIYFWETGAAGKLPVVMADGSTAESVKVLAGRAIQAVAPAYTPETPYVSHFENGITLLGYDASAGGALYLTLYWQLDTTAPLPLDYTVFLHLTDSQGLLLREPADSPPLEGDWPTSAWLPGHQVADARLIALPPELPAGRYNLRVGLYDPVTGVRLPAFRTDGSQWPEDAILIEGIFVR
jgi:hypothetical protein